MVQCSMFNVQSMSSAKIVKIIKLLLYCLASMPLLITPMTNFPFVFGRGLLMQFIIEIIFFLYLALAIADKNYRPKKTALLVLAGLFLSVMFLSSVFGAHFLRSFWSSVERFSGIFFLSHVFLLFIVLGAVFKDKNDWKKFLGMNVLVSVAMFAIAILSLFGVKFWGVDLGTRISGTLGNPLFLGLYFIITLIFALYLGFAAKNIKEKILWFLCSAIIFYGIILTQSRGALYGTIGGIMLGLLYYGLSNKRKKTRLAVGLFMALIVLAAGGLLVFRDSDFVRRHGVLNRVSDLSFASGTGNTRLMSWRVALQAIKERPLLGWGMEGFDVAFNKYYNPEFLKYSYYETWFDKPHNKVLEVAVDGGIIALLLYLLIFTAAGSRIRKKEKRGEFTSREAAVFIGGLAAYFAQNLFVFDTSVSYLLFFILLAFLNFNEKADAAPPKKIPAFLAAIAAIFGISLAWYLNLVPFKAAVQLRSAVLSVAGDKKIDLGSYKKGIGYFNPYKEDWRADLAKSAISSFVRKDNFYSQEENMFILDELKDNLKEYPDSTLFNMFLGIFYAEMGPLDKNYFDLAKKQFDAALLLSPKRQHLYFAMARMYALMGDKENQIKFSEAAINLEPKTYIPYWEGAKQMILAKQSDDPLVYEWLRRAAELGLMPENDMDFKMIFAVTHKYFFEQKNYEVLSGFYERWQVIEPKEAKWHAQRATAEYMLGRFERALAEIKKAIGLDGSYKAEGEAFIEMINNQ